MKIEGKLENNSNKLENLEKSKNKKIEILQSKINSSIYALENHKKKTSSIYKEFEELKNKLENQNKIYETEIVNRKQDNEKVYLDI